MYAIGIDRGGSYTRISVFDSSFNEINSKNFVSDTLEHFVSETYNFLKEINACQVPTVISCKGAMTRKEIRDYITDNLTQKINLKKVISDAEGAHRAAFNEDNGFLIIVGTGSVLIYKKDGVYAIEGGKNPEGGDPGSGKWIGIKYLNSIKKDFSGWNDQTIASYTTEVIKKAKDENDTSCLNILKDAFKELNILIKQAMAKFEGMKKLKIALIGGLSSDEYFRNELSKYTNDNIKDVQIEFFIPETNIQKASALYAIKLQNEK
jgi:N-acetylglucosamine kinase-like BadF-type ATPase